VEEKEGEEVATTPPPSTEEAAAEGKVTGTDGKNGAGCRGSSAGGATAEPETTLKKGAGLAPTCRGESGRGGCRCC